MVRRLAARPAAAALLAALAVPVATLAACGDEGGPECAVDDEKAFAHDLMRAWYLYPDLLPPFVDLDDFTGPAALVRAMTADARAQGIDRGWSYVASIEAVQAQREGAAVGFGFQAVLREDRLFLSDVYRDSAAGEVGFARGDEILAIGETPDALEPVATLIAEDRLGDAFGPAVEGLGRVFDVQPVAGERALRAISKRGFYVNPLPTIAIVPRTDVPDAPPLGYLHLRSFGVTDAAGALTRAFTMLVEAGVEDVVIDLRYNGGGALTIAEQLINHLAGGLRGMPMYTQWHNAVQSPADLAVAFDAIEPRLVRPRVAFIVGPGSASASELVPSVLDPYLEVALIGDRTYGKPVGQYLFDLSPCPTIVALIAFGLDNADGDGEYYEGLPYDGFAGPLCAAPDDLTHPQGDPLEASTAAALHWLTTGTCPEPAATAAPRPRDRFPAAVEPTPTQRDLPGLF